MSGRVRLSRQVSTARVTIFGVSMFHPGDFERAVAAIRSQVPITGSSISKNDVIAEKRMARNNDKISFNTEGRHKIDHWSENAGRPTSETDASVCKHIPVSSRETN